MLGALFCENDLKRKEILAKIKSQFDWVLSISDLDERTVNQILRTNRAALIECRSHRQIPFEIMNLIQPVVLVGRKKAIVSDNFTAFQLPLDKLTEISVPYGDYETYRRRYERRNWFRKLFRRKSKAHLLHIQNP